MIPFCLITVILLLTVFVIVFIMCCVAKNTIYACTSRTRTAVGFWRSVHDHVCRAVFSWAQLVRASPDTVHGLAAPRRARPLRERQARAARCGARGRRRQRHRQHKEAQGRGRPSCRPVSQSFSETHSLAEQSTFLYMLVLDTGVLGCRTGTHFLPLPLSYVCVWG